MQDQMNPEDEDQEWGASTAEPAGRIFLLAAPSS